ncbi:hypothetical protein B0H14DRAFT_2566585 [Mycena olivaceomarginata]|nr:hypothetical protein B0H14DRAFT_2620931 [Mycena olivaceomarginata]KAJ7879735.1 hypothetical protein B0H14DRAFT_2566585 [Mycena olivaceomarginata]
MTGFPERDPPTQTSHESPRNMKRRRRAQTDLAPMEGELDVEEVMEDAADHGTRRLERLQKANSRLIAGGSPQNDRRPVTASTASFPSSPVRRRRILKTSSMEPSLTSSRKRGSGSDVELPPLKRRRGDELNGDK